MKYKKTHRSVDEFRCSQWIGVENLKMLCPVNGSGNNRCLHLDDSLSPVNHFAILCHRDGRLEIVTRHHNSAQMGVVEDSDGRKRLLLQSVAHNQQPNKLRVDFYFVAGHSLNVSPSQMRTESSNVQS